MTDREYEARETLAEAECLGYTLHDEALSLLENAAKAAQWIEARRRHRAYVGMLRRMVASGIHDSTASPDILLDAEIVYARVYGDSLEDVS